MSFSGVFQIDMSSSFAQPVVSPHIDVLLFGLVCSLFFRKSPPSQPASPSRTSPRAQQQAAYMPTFRIPYDGAPIHSYPLKPPSPPSSSPHAPAVLPVADARTRRWVTAHALVDAAPVDSTYSYSLEEHRSVFSDDSDSDSVSSAASHDDQVDSCIIESASDSSEDSERRRRRRGIRDLHDSQYIPPSPSLHQPLHHLLFPPPKSPPRPSGCPSCYQGSSTYHTPQRRASHPRLLARTRFIVQRGGGGGEAGPCTRAAATPPLIAFPLLARRALADDRRLGCVHHALRLRVDPHPLSPLPRPMPPLPHPSSRRRQRRRALVDAQPTRCRQERARARDGRWRVLGWLDEDRQLRVGGTFSISISPLTLLTTLCRPFPPPPPPRHSRLLVPYLLSPFLRTTMEERKPHPPLSSYSHFLSHAHSVFGTSLPTIEDTHIQNDDERRPSQNDLAAHASVFLCLASPPATTGFIPRYFLSCLPTSQRAPTICPIHYHMLFLCILISTICISHRHRYSRPSPPSSRWVIRLSCTECNNRSNLRLR
jgi:hypothetical protein